MPNYDKNYFFTRDGLNPWRDQRSPYQNEMVQWNDGYDKGYERAWKEATELAESKLNSRIQELEETIARLQNPQDKTGL